MAATALAFAVFGLLTFFVTFAIPAIVGVILGLTALSRAKRLADPKGRRLAIAAVITGAIATIITIVVITSAIITVSNYNHVVGSTDYQYTKSIAIDADMTGYVQNTPTTVNDLNSALAQNQFTGTLTQVNSTPVGQLPPSTVVLTARFTFPDGHCYIAHFQDKTDSNPTVSAC